MRYLTEEYLFLFNVITAAEETLTQLRATLVDAQQQAEELFLSREADV